MSVALTITDKLYSRDEYRRWCALQPVGRYERVDGRIIAMAPERVGHARIKQNVSRALERAISRAGLPCEALPDGVTVETGESDYEPDALVTCGEPAADDDIAATPVIVVEVLSPGTGATDTGAKLAGYFRLQSIDHYLIVHPAKRLVIHHRRAVDAIVTCLIFDGDVVMDPPGITISLDEIYARATSKA